MKITLGLLMIVILFTSCFFELTFPMYAGSIAWFFGMFEGVLICEFSRLCNDSQS